MDESLVLWIFLLVILFWQWVCQRDPADVLAPDNVANKGACALIRKLLRLLRRWAGKVQEGIHYVCRCWFAWVLQWYSLLLIGLGLLLVRSSWDILTIDYWKLSLLDPETIHEQLPSSLTDAEKESLRLSFPLRVVSVAAPLVSIGAFLVVVWHVGQNVLFGFRLQTKAKCRICNERMIDRCTADQQCSKPGCASTRVRWCCKPETIYMCGEHAAVIAQLKTNHAVLEANNARDCVYCLNALKNRNTMRCLDCEVRFGKYPRACYKSYKKVTINGSAPECIEPGCSSPSTTQFVKLCNLSDMENDDGVPVHLGQDRTTNYCGRNLGTNEIPGSEDGICGPRLGPQCPSCNRYQESQAYKYVLCDECVKEEANCPLAPRVLQNNVLMGLMMPAVFVVLALRAEIRMLAIMTGSALDPYRNPTPADWMYVKRLELSTYTTDLSLACTFQFFTVWTFGLLVGHYLPGESGRPSKDGPRSSPSFYASLQGVHLYCLCGVVQAVLSILIACLRENKENVHAYFTNVLQNQVVPYLSPIMLMSTILAVYNMYQLSRMKDVAFQLGTDINLKFSATRALLVVAQLQPMVFAAFTEGSWFLRKLGHMPSWTGLQVVPDFILISVPRAKLWHSAILCIECLAVVLCNVSLWRNNPRYFDEPKSDEGRTARARSPNQEGYLLL